VETAVLAGCNARAPARGGGIRLMRPAPKECVLRCAHSPTGSRFREIAAALTPPYRTPRVTAPALPTADAAQDAQNQGSTELRLNGVLRSSQCKREGPEAYPPGPSAHLRASDCPPPPRVSPAPSLKSNLSSRSRRPTPSWRQRCTSRALPSRRGSGRGDRRRAR
jgi:hypothetical protein